MRQDGAVTPLSPGASSGGGTFPVLETSLVGDPGRAPAADPGEEKGGLLSVLRWFIARRRADALLRRTLRPYRRGGVAPLSSRVLSDIGLPPDFRM